MEVLELADWRRQVGELYAQVRAEDDPQAAHLRWRRGRDELFAHHPQSPLSADSPLSRAGLPYWPYDPALRYQLTILPSPSPPAQLSISTGGDEHTSLTRVGYLELPAPFDARLDLWQLDQYGGGLFLPLRDGTAGDTSYGGGRYVLDTAKGADLGGTDGELVVDLNFAYHPSCRYDARWQCPLAPAGNTITALVQAGERL